MNDERQETLREMAAIGNLKAVIQFVRVGVDVNSANRINGWTALHWASHRGQSEVVGFLLQNGADPSLINKEGKTPSQLAKHPKVCELLNAPPPEHTAPQATQPEPEFIPNYLSNPDLAKLWGTPSQEELFAVPEPFQSPIPVNNSLPTSQKAESMSVQAELGSTFSGRSVGGTCDITTIKEEILVYAIPEGTEPIIIGAVYADPSITLQALQDQIINELTDLPRPFTLRKRNRSGHPIPLHAGQFSLPWSDILRPSNGDALLLEPTSSS